MRLELQDAFVDLFSESSARAMVVVSDEQHEAFMDLAQQHGVDVTAVGVTGGSSVQVTGWFDLDLAATEAAWRATLPAVLGRIL